jgi:hypothetical protein
LTYSKHWLQISTLRSEYAQVKNHTARIIIIIPRRVSLARICNGEAKSEFFGKVTGIKILSRKLGFDASGLLDGAVEAE